MAYNAGHRQDRGAYRSMTITFRAMSVEPFSAMLRNLSILLDKATVQAAVAGWPQSSLLQTRLAPDMWPLLRQIQFTCWQAANGCARLACVEPLFSEENETSIRDLQGRIRATIAFIEAIPALAFNGAEDRYVTFIIPDGRNFRMTGLAYLRDWLTPMFYFHATTGYDLLRLQGVQIGKMDFLKHCEYAISTPVVNDAIA
jgi:hypothetical protein